jgi:predicted hotdog family 3-hydroxylacyl-ACP dehydratase
MDVTSVDPRTLVPHGGEMCLLTRIVRTSDAEIVCATDSHRSPANPLRHAGRLAALHLAEYGAQAAAIHGGLEGAGEGSRSGMLAAIRDLVLLVDRLDDLPDELTISAVRMIANADGRIYAFEARAGARELGRGRISVIFGK